MEHKSQCHLEHKCLWGQPKVLEGNTPVSANTVKLCGEALPAPAAPHTGQNRALPAQRKQPTVLSLADDFSVVQVRPHDRI